MADVSDPWRRFGEIWFSIMKPCCVPPICEATIRRCPTWACPMYSRQKWEKAVAAWNQEHDLQKAQAGVPE